MRGVAVLSCREQILGEDEGGNKDALKIIKIAFWLIIERQWKSFFCLLIGNNYKATS